MLRKRGVVAALLAAVAATAAAVAATATAMTNAPAARANADTALVKCGKTRSFGLLAPITGPAASLGGLQVDWVQYYVSKWNATHKTAKLKIVKGDTVLGGPGGTAEAVKAAQSFGSNVLGVVGPAGSNEVRATTATLKNAGFGFVSGSATNTELTTDGTRTGFFFRTVPPDSAQGASVANFIIKKLKYRLGYIIDDQEAYSTGLADTVQQKLRAAGVTVSRDGVSQQQSDFSPLIAKIPRDTQLVYIPWQLPPKGKAFGEQMKQAGKGSIRLMGADGLYSDDFASVGTNVYATNFPVNPNSGIIKAFKKSHGGQGYYFGAPVYAAVQVVAAAYDKACANGTATRAEVRSYLKKTKIPESR